MASTETIAFLSHSLAFPFFLTCDTLQTGILLLTRSLGKKPQKGFSGCSLLVINSAITAGVTCTTEIRQISSSLPPEVAANNLEK